MLGLTIEELYEMDASTFAIYVESHLMYQREKDDFLMESLAQYTAHIMVSSGNMKKNTKPDDIAKNLHKTIDKIIEENKPKDSIKEEAETEKEKLRKRFNL